MGQIDKIANIDANAWFERNRDKINFDGANPNYSFVQEYARKGCSILEIGCSAGQNSLIFKDIPNYSYVGVDPSDRAIEYAKKKFPKHEFHLGQADDLCFLKDQKFDLIILGFFLYLVDRELLSKIVWEVDKRLSDNGFVAIMDFHGGDSHTVKPYGHLKGTYVFKYDYEKMFLGFPSYKIVEKRTPVRSEDFDFDMMESVSIIKKVKI